MPKGRAPAFHGAIGWPHYRGRVAQQDEVVGAERPGNVQGVDQRQPLGVAVGAVSEIAQDMRLTRRDDRDLDRAGIGPASTVEEDLYA